MKFSKYIGFPLSYAICLVLVAHEAQAKVSTSQIQDMSKWTQDQVYAYLDKYNIDYDRQDQNLLKLAQHYNKAAAANTDIFIHQKSDSLSHLLSTLHTDLKHRYHLPSKQAQELITNLTHDLRQLELVGQLQPDRVQAVLDRQPLDRTTLDYPALSRQLTRPFQPPTWYQRLLHTHPSFPTNQSLHHWLNSRLASVTQDPHQLSILTTTLTHAIQSSPLDQIATQAWWDSVLSSLNLPQLDLSPVRSDLNAFKIFAKDYVEPVESVGLLGSAKRFVVGLFESVVHPAQDERLVIASSAAARATRQADASASSLKARVTEAVEENLNEAAEGVKVAAEGAAGYAYEGAKGAAEGAKGAAEGAAGYAYEGAKGAAEGAKGAAEGAAGYAYKGAKGAAEGAAGYVYGGAKVAADSAKGAAGYAYEGAKGAAGYVYGGAKGAVDQAADGAKVAADSAKGAAGYAYEGAKGAADYVYGGAKGAVDQAADGAKVAADSAKGAAGYAYEGAKGAADYGAKVAAGSANEAKDYVVDTATQAKNYVVQAKNTLGSYWRQKQLDSYRKLGYTQAHVDWIDQYLSKTFRNRKDYAKGTVQDALKNVRQYLVSAKIQTLTSIDDQLKALEDTIEHFRLSTVHDEL